MFGGVAGVSAQTLTVGVAALPPGKGNPHGALIDYLDTWSALFDPLTQVTEQGALEPWLATSWEQTAPTEWEITLRDGVVFSNGRPFDTASVVTALAYLQSDAGRGESVSRALSFVDSAEAIGPLTLRLTTTQPRPVLPYDLQMLRVPEPETWQRLGPAGFAAAPVGTGPFDVTRWGPAEVRLAAVERSWRAPKIDGLTLRLVRDSTNRLNGFLTGELDVVTDVAPDMVADVQARGGRLRETPVPGAMAIVFNTVKDARFQDPRVRQALNYAVNKQAIIDVLFDGYATPVSQPAPRIALGHNPDLAPYRFDPERARALLAEAGYPDGLSFTLEASGEASDALQAYQQIAADLAHVGVDMRIELLLRPQFLERLQRGSWTGSAFPIGYFNAALDGLSILQGNSCLRPNPWHCDEAIVPKLEEALSEQSLARRTQLTQQLMAHAHETAIGLFLYEFISLSASQRPVTGLSGFGPFILYEQLEIAP